MSIEGIVLSALVCCDVAYELCWVVVVRWSISSGGRAFFALLKDFVRVSERVRVVPV